MLKKLPLLRSVSWALPVLLVLITTIICITNYRWGTWLTGWDTLHPEFDFPLHLYRSVFGVWREDQGLGTLAAHSHMSELPRILVLWLFSLVLPLSFVKYLYVFICFILGPLGIFFFTRDGILKQKTLAAQAASFLAALAYVFNLGTVQHFYVVFEMFAVQYAALGWLFLWASKIIEKNKTKDKAIFFALSFLAAPMAYASLLWFAYAAALGLFLVTLYFFQRDKKYFYRLVTISLLSVGANAFWLFPNLYFILSGQSEVINNSFINKQFSPEAFLHNQAYGNLQDLALLRNFLFNWLELKNNQFVPLLQLWNIYSNLLFIKAIGFAIFVIAALGVFFSFIHRKKEHLALLPIVLLGIFMLINQNFPFTPIFVWLRQHLSLFEEGLRFPFTKFSLVYMLAFFTFFGVAAHALLQRIETHLKEKGVFIVTGILSLLLILYGLPMFGGYLINPKMRNNIPAAYFEFFDIMETKPAQKRVAVLPLETPFGWQYNAWNYEGPGFVWFGIRQPTLVRDFDRWSTYNETFYHQLATSVYGNNTKQFFETLQTFDVSYLLLDESQFAPNKTAADIKIPETKKMLSDAGITPTWQKDFLSLYELPTSSSNFVHIPGETQEVAADTEYSRKNPVISSGIMSYIQTSNKSGILFPFSGLASTKELSSVLNPETNSLEYTLPKNSEEKKLRLPPASVSPYFSIPAEVLFTGNQLLLTFSPTVTIQIDDQETSLSTLPQIIQNVGNNSEAVYINSELQQLKIQRNRPLKTNIYFSTQKATVLTAFAAENVINENGSLFIDQENIVSLNIPPSSLEEITREKEIDIPSTAKKVVVFLHSNKEEIAIGAFNNLLNCDPFKRGSVEKQVETKGASYIATNFAVACDGTSLPSLSNQISYLVSIKGKGLAGRGSKLYITNNANTKTDLETLLPQTSFSSVYGLGSWPYLQNDDYYVSLETKTFGNSVSKNTVEELSFTPLNLDQLSQIKITSDNSLSYINDTQVINHWKFGTHAYGGKVVVNSEKGILTLSQGYDKGWIAFRSPFRLLEHASYNGWANAWILPPGEYQITILFWPQLLSFLGFGVLIISSGILLVHSVRLKKVS